MTPRLDADSFDGFVSGHDVAVVGFIGADGQDALKFSEAAGEATTGRAGTAAAMVGAEHTGLFAMFGLSDSATAIFRNRVVFYLEPGIPSGGQLGALLDRVLAVDFERARAEIEQQRVAEAALATHRVCPTARRGKLS